MSGLRVLVVDDEPPALDELTYLVSHAPGVAEVAGAGDATEALRYLHDHEVDALFLDINMPGLDGLELARVMSRFARPPRVVFVTAHEQHAVEAFELRATDYLLKPVRRERLREALDRVRHPAAGEEPASASATEPGRAGADIDDTDDTDDTEADDLAVVPVETAGRTRFVERAAVYWAEARGDYVRLHTGSESHLVRVPMAVLEAAWSPHGFFRIHRGYLVSLRRIEEVRADSRRGYWVRIGDAELPVSRRHARDFKERLLRIARVTRSSG